MEALILIPVSVAYFAALKCWGRKLDKALTNELS